MDEEAKAVQESAKAVQEVAKAAPRVLDSVDACGSFLRQLIGNPVLEISGMFHDWLKYKRENLQRVRQLVDSTLRERGIADQTQPIPLKYALPLLESAALEDDDLLQDMWAGLIANSLDPGTRFQARKLIQSVLSELEPTDAFILQRLATGETMEDENRNPSSLARELKQSTWELRLSLINLYRLGLVFNVKSERVPQTWDDFADPPPAQSVSGARTYDDEVDFQLTELGNELLEACKR